MTTGIDPAEELRRRHMAMIGDLLRAVREEQGLSIEEVAAAAGLSVQWLRLLERGQRRTRRVTLAALASALVGEDRAEAVYDELLELAERGGTLHGVGWSRRPKNPTPPIVRDAQRLLRAAEDLVERLDEAHRAGDDPDQAGVTRTAQLLGSARELLAGPAVARALEGLRSCTGP